LTGISRLTSGTPSVIVGREDDPHAGAVATAIERDGTPVVLLDVERLSTADIIVDRAHVALADDAGRLIDLSGGRGWLRRLAPEDWRDHGTPGSHEAVVRSAWVSALVTVARLAGLTWLSPLDVLFTAEDKLTQQRACNALGIPTPHTVLVTRPSHIPDALGDWLVVKPVAAGHFRDASGDGRVVHATGMHRSDQRLELLAGAPFLVQRRITARAHLRVVTVANEIWVCELDADDRPLDWRADEAAHSSFRAAARPEVAAMAAALATSMGVGYSSQDWIVDQDGLAHFLDLNPAGQWLFLPDAIASATTEAIALWLTNPS
jgi:hypothetical protein